MRGVGYARVGYARVYCSNDGPIRAVQYTFFLGTRLTDRKRRYQSRRCGDDSHPGEEICTPSGNEAWRAGLYETYPATLIVHLSAVYQREQWSGIALNGRVF